MKKLFLAMAGVMLMCGVGRADSKISAMTSTTTLNGSDILPVVVTPGSNPLNRSITYTNFINGMTGIPASKLTGSLPSSVLPSTVAYLNANQQWTAPQTFGSSVTITNAVSMGAAGQAVSVSSNTILAGATFYQGGGGEVLSAPVKVGVSSTNSCGYIIGTFVQTVSSASIAAQSIAATSFSTATITNATITLKCASDEVRATWTGTAISQSTAISLLSIWRNGTDLAAPGTNGLTAISPASIGNNYVYPVNIMAIDLYPGSVGPFTYVLVAKQSSSNGDTDICEGNLNQTTCRMYLEEIAE